MLLLLLFIELWIMILLFLAITLLSRLIISDFVYFFDLFLFNFWRSAISVCVCNYFFCLFLLQFTSLPDRLALRLFIEKFLWYFTCFVSFFCKLLWLLFGVIFVASAFQFYCSFVFYIGVFLRKWISPSNLRMSGSFWNQLSKNMKRFVWVVVVKNSLTQFRTICGAWNCKSIKKIA